MDFRNGMRQLRCATAPLLITNRLTVPCYPHMTGSKHMRVSNTDPRLLAQSTLRTSSARIHSSPSGTSNGTFSLLMRTICIIDTPRNVPHLKIKIFSGLTELFLMTRHWRGAHKFSRGRHGIKGNISLATFGPYS